MKVITLSSWAGRCFDIAHGSLVDMPDHVASIRIEAGVVREATAEEIATLDLKPFPGVVQPAAERPAERPTSRERLTLHLPTKGKRR